MAEPNVAFIGFGFMGSALAKGFINKNVLKANQIYAADAYADFDSLASLGINLSRDNNEVVSKADIVILAVKPHMVSDVIKKIPSELQLDKKLIISIAAGVKLDVLNRDIYGCDDISSSRVFRVMPSQPCLVGEGCSMVCCLPTASSEDIHTVETLFNSVGYCLTLNEKYMDAFVGIAGSAPAYVFTFIEALADAGVKHGIPRKESVEIATQITLGSAKLVQETKQHTGILRDNVCSPGGATSAGVAAMERTGLRNSVIQTVDAVVQRHIELSKN